MPLLRSCTYYLLYSSAPVFTGLLIFLLCLVTGTSLYGQQGEKNPFELSYRDIAGLVIEEPKNNGTVPIQEESNAEDLIDDEPERIDLNIAIDPGNPFEINRSGDAPSPKVAAPVVKKPEEGLALPKREAVRKARPADSDRSLRSFLFWIFTGLLVYLAIALTLFRFFLVRIYRAFSNDNFLKLLHRELKGGVVYPYWMFYLFFFLNAAVFCFLTARFYRVWEDQANAYLLLYCFAGVLIAFLGKQTLLKILAWIFPFGQTLNHYNFAITIFGSILGIVLFPINIFLAFSATPIPEIALYCGFGAIVITYIYRYLRSIFSAGRLIIFHRFHFFVYLCSVEIAPALIIAKVIYDQAGF
jgi:hypothetical protein